MLEKTEIIERINEQHPIITGTAERVQSLKSKFSPIKLGNFDNARRWFPKCEIAQDWCGRYRTPSRAFPYSYLQACKTNKFFAHYHKLTPTDLLAHKLIHGLKDLDGTDEEIGTAYRRIMKKCRAIEERLNKGE